MLRTRSGVPLRLVRPLSWLAVLSLISAALFVPATSVTAAPPGNNGTVKIEDSVDPKDEPANDPHVCQFDIKFFFSDPEQSGDWYIESWPPTGDGTTVLSGTYETNGVGFDREPDEGYFSLLDGHYKLFWKGDEENLWKHKVFWVECQASEPESTPTPTPDDDDDEDEDESTPTPTPDDDDDEDEDESTPTPTPDDDDDEDAAPTGGVGPVTGSRPTARPTLPPTDTLDGVASTSSAGDSWRLVVLAMAGLLTAALMLTPARAVVRKDDSTR
jgi:hypothetical protein